MKTKTKNALRLVQVNEPTYTSKNGVLRRSVKIKTNNGFEFYARKNDLKEKAL